MATIVEQKPALIFSGPTPKSLSRLQTAGRCLQEYAYRYLGMGGNVMSAPLLKGALIHVGIAHHAKRVQLWRLGQDPEQYYPPLTAMALTAALPEFAGAYGLEVAKHLESCQAVVARFCEEEHFDRWDILHVEEAFEFTVPYGDRVYNYTQKPDLVLRERATGRVKPTDAKSSGRMSEASVARYATDLKMLGLQWWTGRKWAAEYGGVEVLSIGSAPPYGHGFYPLPASPKMVQRFPQIVDDLERTLERLAAEGRKMDEYPASPHELTCWHSYGPCAFRESCQWGKPEGFVRLPTKMTMEF